MAIEGERWEWIPGYEGRYFISNYGNVVAAGGMRGSEPYKPMRQNLCSSGYPKVVLRDGGSSKNVMVHRIVAMVFVPNPANKPQVNHIDGNKLNNVYTNLEWVTQSENNLHAINVLGRHGHGVERPVKINSDIAREIYLSDLSNIELARMYGISDTMVSRIKNGKAWRSVSCQSIA